MTLLFAVVYFVSADFTVTKYRNCDQVIGFWSQWSEWSTCECKAAVTSRFCNGYCKQRTAHFCKKKYK